MSFKYKTLREVPIGELQVPTTRKLAMSFAAAYRTPTFGGIGLTVEGASKQEKQWSVTINYFDLAGKRVRMCTLPLFSDGNGGMFVRVPNLVKISSTEYDDRDIWLPKNVA